MISICVISLNERNDWLRYYALLLDHPLIKHGYTKLYICCILNYIYRFVKNHYRAACNRHRIKKEMEKLQKYAIRGYKIIKTKEKKRTMGQHLKIGKTVWGLIITNHCTSQCGWGASYSLFALVFHGCGGYSACNVKRFSRLSQCYRVLGLSFRIIQYVAKSSTCRY